MDSQDSRGRDRSRYGVIWLRNGGIHLWLPSWHQDTPRKSVEHFWDRQLFHTAGLSQLMIPVVCTWKTHGWKHGRPKGSMVGLVGQVGPSFNRASNLPQPRGTPSHFGLHFQHHLPGCDDLVIQIVHDAGPSMYTSTYIKNTSTLIIINILCLYISIPTAFIFSHQRPLPEELYEHVGSRHACRST